MIIAILLAVAVLLALVICIYAAVVTARRADDEAEELRWWLMLRAERRNKQCDSCRHDLGGGCCGINAEGECREGGGFELWEEEK